MYFFTNSFGMKCRATSRWTPRAAHAATAKAPGWSVMCAGRGTIAGTESAGKEMMSGASIGTSLLRQLPDPDVPVARRVPVVLQEEGKPVRMRLVVRTRGVPRPAGDDRIVVHQHPVVQHRDPRGVAHRTIGREPGTVEDDVVGLPLAGGP